MKTEEEKRRKGEEEIEFLPVIDGELVEILPAEIESIEEDDADDDAPTVVSVKPAVKSEAIEKKSQKNKSEIRNPKSQIQSQRIYLLLPFIFLTVTLLGGLRLSAPDNAFIFWRPALFCLISAAILMVLFFRARLINLEGWFSEDFTSLKNIANIAVLLTLFAASAQIFNALLPEQGLPFLVVAFCFFWTLIMNFFGSFEAKTFLRFLGAMCGLAFIVKYLILLNLTAPEAESWWQGILQNPTKEAFTRLFDLPRFSAGTGYIQFFTIVFYLLGLFLLPNSSKTNN